MNELLELLPVPAERDLPPGCLEQRKAALLDLVAADLRAGGEATRPSRLRSLRVWLLSLLLVVALSAALVLAAAPGRSAGSGTRDLVEATVVGAGGPIAASLALAARPSPERLLDPTTQRALFPRLAVPTVSGS